MTVMMLMMLMMNAAVLFFIGCGCWDVWSSWSVVVGVQAHQIFSFPLGHRRRRRRSSVVHQPRQPQHQQRQRDLKHPSEVIKNHDNVNQHDNNATSSAQVASLFQGEGTHFVDLWVGTPPQRQSVIVDTGSDVTAFPCVGCTGEGCDSGGGGGSGDGKDEEDHHHHRLDELFDVDASSTFHYLTCEECFKGICHPKADSCHLKATYREGSGWKAREARDYCYPGGFHGTPASLSLSSAEGAAIAHLRRRRKKEESLLPPVVDGMNPFYATQFRFPLQFGCQTSLTGAFATQLEDGILGMENREGTLWRQMYKAGVLKHRGFALCFGRSPRVEARAGVLTLGGFDERLHEDAPKHSVVYSRGLPAEMDSVYFGVLVRHIYLRKDSEIIRLNVSASHINANPIVVDSGATDTYLTKAVIPSFQQAWKHLSGNIFRNHRPLKSIDHLPTLVFQLKGDYDRNKLLLPKQRNHPLLAGSVDPQHAYDVLLSIPPSHLYEYHEENENYVARFHFDPDYDSAFGSSAMMGHDIYFEEERIGWATSSCDYIAILAKHGVKEDAAQAAADKRMKKNDAEDKENNGEREGESEEQAEEEEGVDKTSTDKSDNNDIAEGGQEEDQETVLDDDDSEATEGEIPEFRGFNLTAALKFTRSMRHPPQRRQERPLLPPPPPPPAAAVKLMMKTTTGHSESSASSLSHTLSRYGMVVVSVVLIAAVARWMRKRRRRKRQYTRLSSSSSPQPSLKSIDSDDSQEDNQEEGHHRFKDMAPSLALNASVLHNDRKDEVLSKGRLRKQNGHDLMRRSHGHSSPKTFSPR